MRKIILFSTCALFLAGGVAVCCFEEMRGFWPFRPYIAPPGDERAMIEAREKLPIESIASRLPQGKAIAPSKALSEEVKTYWEQIEQTFVAGDRADMLKALHEKTRNVFAERPGNGFERMRPPTPAEILFNEYRGDRAQPGSPVDSPLSSGETIDRMEAVPSMRDFHRYNVSAFFPAWNFGYVRDREHVAGFRPHGFAWVNQPGDKKLRLDHVLLIGILSHPQPVVYVTEKLPSMEKIKDTPTRTLDFIEASGLAALRDGEDVYIAGKGDALQMVGALRATKTCLKCHDADVGDLLGAFSYSLRKIEAK